MVILVDNGNQDVTGDHYSGGGVLGILTEIQQGIRDLREDFGVLKKDVGVVKQDVGILKQDVEQLKGLIYSLDRRSIRVSLLS